MKNYPLVNYDNVGDAQGDGKYWQQIKRTVHGKPVDEEQILMIESAICSGLELNGDDVLLDLACGNGALSKRLLNKCRRIHGVDISQEFIETAKSDFEAPPLLVFEQMDAYQFVLRANCPESYTKVLIYGAFQYFSPESARAVIQRIANYFPNVSRVHLGNLPNRDKSSEFYKDRTPSEEELSDHEAVIGIWYEPEWFEKLSEEIGWQCDSYAMPDKFYAAKYRFDAILSRGNHD